MMTVHIRAQSANIINSYATVATLVDTVARDDAAIAPSSHGILVQVQDVGCLFRPQ